jgi:hypothetical protein
MDNKTIYLLKASVLINKKKKKQRENLPIRKKGLPLLLHFKEENISIK